MAGSVPVITQNDVSADTVSPGGNGTWTVRAQDATARTFVMRRPVTDTQGNTVEVTNAVTISEVLTYGTPTCDDPAVSFTVDPTDPSIVRYAVAADA